MTSSPACLFSSLNATVVALVYDEICDEIYDSLRETMRKRQRCSYQKKEVKRESDMLGNTNLIDGSFECGI